MTNPLFPCRARLRPLVWATALTLAATLAHAGGARDDKSEPQADANGHIAKKIGHRLADWVQTISPFDSLSGVRHAGLPPVGSTTASTAPITYHGGAIMPRISKIVVIWYGNWAQTNGSDNAAGQQIVLDALYGLTSAGGAGLTNYSGITTGAGGSSLGTYTQTDNSFVSAISSTTITTVTQKTSTTYGGTRLTDANVLKLVKDKGGVPDANAIYLVLSSSDIAESSGFLTSYCGWHSYNASSFGGTTVKYAFIGNPKKSLGSCSYQTTVSPNGNPGVDAMVSVIAHELMEAATDPQLNAWYNSAGAENADMCGWTFGSNQTLLPNGSYYNVTLPTQTGSSRNYLLQRALARNDSKCYINATGNVQ